MIQIYNMDVREALKKLPNESVNCVVTSPPYWALRDYGEGSESVWGGSMDCEHEWGDGIIGAGSRTNDSHSASFQKESLGSVNRDKRPLTNFCCKCGAWKGQLGLEPTFDLYIKNLCDIFDEVKRVLRKDGTCFVNLGDTYASTPSGSKGNQEGTDGVFGRLWNRNTINDKTSQRKKEYGLSEKSLCMIPFRFAIEMQNRDTMDIYELNERFINKEVFIVSEDKTDAIQGQKESTGIQHSLSKEMESQSSSTVSEKIEGMAGKEQGQNQSIQQEILLSEQGEGNNQSNGGKCQKTSQIKDRSNNSLWGKSSDLSMLWRISFAFFNNRPYRWEWCETQEGNKELRNLRMVEEDEIPKGVSDIMYELQLGKGKIQNLSTSRREKFTIRKRDIPSELQKYFKLIKEERWCLRNTIIWHKPNVMPSSAKDRFTVDFEYVFFFVKNKRYWFETQYDKLAESSLTDSRLDRGREEHIGKSAEGKYGMNATVINSQGKNKRTVWTITTQPFKESHFAVFPEELIETPIKAGCPQFVCNKCGRARERITESLGTGMDYSNNSNYERQIPDRTVRHAKIKLNAKYIYKGISDCGCNSDFSSGVVLDPFVGSGTTCFVARRLHRDSIGIEIKKEYVDIIKKRLFRGNQTLIPEEFKIIR